MRVLPISEYPEVVPPSRSWSAPVSRAPIPKVIAETVATPLERQINGVENMLYMSAQATSDGVMTLTVTFKLGTDPDKAQQQVQNRVSQAEPRLPEEVRRIGITTVKSSPDLTMVVHLLSPDDRYDMTYLRNYAVLNVKDALRASRASGRCRCSAAATTRCASGSTRPRLAARPLRSDVVARSASRTCRSRPA
jgi:multidrug efflux pump